MKHVIALFFGIILGISSVSLVFGGLTTNLQNIHVDYILSKNIYLSSQELNSTVIGFNHEGDIQGYTLFSTCRTKSEFLGKQNFTSYFKITFFDKECKDSYVSLQRNEKPVEKTSLKLNLVSEKELYTALLDLNTTQLEDIVRKVDKKIVSLTENTSQKDLKQKRLSEELNYQKSFVENLVGKRKMKYLIPVEGFPLPSENSKIPNSARPYRTGYTDGIHHSWDIDAKTGTPVIALDDAIIVRVVDNWTWGSLSNLRKGENLTLEDKERNLDILRGNQVRIKTMKGEVVFYNHLETVASGLKEGQYIARGTTLGTIGVSGVPEVGYDDSHLDFSIMVNPHNASKAGTYEPEDYMFWNWKMKGKPREYILEHQYDIFEK